MKKVMLSFVLILCILVGSVTIAFAENTVRQMVLVKHQRWENPQRIYTYVPAGSRNTELMKEAFAYWTRVTNGKVRFIYVNDIQKAQLRVRFVKDASVSSNHDNALGVTYYKKVKTVCKGMSCDAYMVLTTIDIADNAPRGALLRKDAVFRVMIHEIGHSIGLSHSTDKMSVMYPTKLSRNQALSKSDFDSLAKLYGWKNY